MNYPFQTARLRVRDFTPDDRDAFHDMLSNPNVMRHIKGTLNREESDHELIRFICRHEDPNDFVHVWAIESEADDCIGLCGVYDNGKGENELAYRLRERYWGQGYGKEIAGALIDHCLDVLKVDKLTAYVRAANTGSVRIL
ncbi:MAG: GNAT family N-acetyltransferase, partial [Lewinella sp.]